MPVDYIPFRQILGTCCCDIFLAQGLQHRRAGHPQERRPVDIGQGQDGQDHVLQGIDEHIKAPIEQAVNRE